MIDPLMMVLREFALAGVATLGFGLLFNVPPRTLLACCITGAIGRAARLIAVSLGTSLEAGTFLGAIFVGILGYIFARKFRMPRAIFTVTGVIPMVPGVPAFTSMIEFANGNIDAGLAATVKTILLGGGLALGLTTVRVLTRMPGQSPDS